MGDDSELLAERLAIRLAIRGCRQSIEDSELGGNHVRGQLVLEVLGEFF